MYFGSLNEVKEIVLQTRHPTQKYIDIARQRQDSLTKPSGSLGRLEEIAIFMAGWLKQEKPVLSDVRSCIFAGNHGVVQQGVSCFPSEVTAQMVANFNAKGAAINQLCDLNGIDLHVIPIKLEEPVNDFTQHFAMSEEELLEAINIGASQVDSKIDLILPGEMGIGNTTSSAAICYLLYKGKIQNWIGRGTGVNQEGLNKKKNVLKKAYKLHTEFCHGNPLRILQAVGGREIAAIMGLIIAARHYSIPVILDGFIACSAAAIIHTLNSDALSHCLASHLSNENGHKNLLKHLQKVPLLNLDMRLGEGSGAAVSYAIIKAALATHNYMATFSEAQVSNKDDGVLS